MLGGDERRRPKRRADRKAGTSAGGRGVPVRRKLSEAGGEKITAYVALGREGKRGQRHFAEHKKSAHASDAGSGCEVKKDATGIANGSGWRSRRSGGSSTYLGFRRFSLRGHQKVQAGVAIGLRGVKSEGIAGPDTS